jgi:hypothetical protein
MVGANGRDTLDKTIVAGGNRLRLPKALRLVWSSPLFGALARAGIELCALVGGVALAVAAIAASAQPSDKSTDSVPPPTRAQQLVSKSDEHRIVGKVLELDREAGRVKLATEEAGVVTLDVLGQAARAFRVGDTVSISRSSIKLRSASPLAVTGDQALLTTSLGGRRPSSRRTHNAASTRALAS